MRYFILAFLVISNSNLFAQVANFGTYRLKASTIGDSVTITMLKLNCDFTYSRYSPNTKEWGKWHIDRDGAIILNRDSISNDDKTIEYHLQSYFRYRDGKIVLDEREYSEKAFKREVKKANEIFRKNNINIKSKSGKEEYALFKVTMMGRYFEKTESEDCK